MISGEPRQIRRDHLQGRQGAIGQFRRLPGDPDRRGAAGDQRTHRARRRRHAAQRRRRAGRASLCPRPDQRHLRRNGEAHPGPADREAA
jgi:hypothetical protein